MRPLTGEQGVGSARTRGLQLSKGLAPARCGRTLGWNTDGTALVGSRVTQKAKYKTKKRFPLHIQVIFQIRSDLAYRLHDDRG